MIALKEGRKVENVIKATQRLARARERSKAILVCYLFSGCTFKLPEGIGWKPEFWFCFWLEEAIFGMESLK